MDGCMLIVLKGLKMKSKITLNGKEYDCEVRDGIRYIDGMVSTEFIDFLTKNGEWMALSDLAKIGMKVIQDIKQKQSRSYQKMADELYQKKAN